MLLIESEGNEKGRELRKMLILKNIRNVNKDKELRSSKDSTWI